MDRKAIGAALAALLSFVAGLASMINFKALPLSIVLWTVTAFCLLYLLALWLQAAPRVAWLYWKWDWPWWGIVPLSAAAELAFNRLRGTDYESEALRHPTAEERLDHMAMYLAIEAREIYGRKPPGALRIVPRLMYQAAGQFQGGAARIHGWGNPEPFAEDLHIARADLWAALSYIEQDAKKL
jgi:hypothetical protein